MITVDVLFPALNKRFEFILSMNISIETLICEMIEMISQNEHIPANLDISGLILCDTDSMRILDPNATLTQYGIMRATRLMLI